MRTQPEEWTNHHPFSCRTHGVSSKKSFSTGCFCSIVGEQARVRSRAFVSSRLPLFFKLGVLSRRSLSTRQELKSCFRSRKDAKSSSKRRGGEVRENDQASGGEWSFFIEKVVEGRRVKREEL